MTTSIFTRVEKRKAFPVEVAGQVVHIAEPTMGQIRRVKALGGENSTGLALGFCLVNSAGDRLLEQPEGESDADFAQRVLEGPISDLTISEVTAISAAILRLSKPVSQDSLAKN